ncbi:LPXTG cell wall anchor domain-containing protein [Staphylococcus hominis]|uniref:LPXTG cell wall anchor domain-containing protein n=1 Tax=Staphylococcus hominis TaxID=1290 RepID=UPI00287FA920|nr:LPXTG cell wall anchor domain-containing protein [Staphylococcus hominis]
MSDSTSASTSLSESTSTSVSDSTSASTSLSGSTSTSVSDSTSASEMQHSMHHAHSHSQLPKHHEDLPETGEENSNSSILVSAVAAMLAGLGMIRRSRKNKKDSDRQRR